MLPMQGAAVLNEIALSSVLQQILVHRNRLRGSLPSGLSCLRARGWRLSENTLTGALPAVFDSNIVDFEASKNQLSGSVPEGLFSSEAMQMVIANKNMISGALPAAIGGLPQLVLIQVMENRIAGTIPDGIHLCQAMNYFFVQNNQISGTLPGSALPGLATLDVSSNRICGRIPESIGSYTALTELDLYKNKLSGALPDRVALLSAALKFVQVFRNAFQGALPDEYRKLRSLHRLDVNANQLTGSIPSVCIASMSDLDCLHLSQNSFSGSLPHNLVILSKLTGLNINENGFVGTFPVAFQALSRLRLADCGKNMMEGTLPSSFRSLAKLSYLGIAGKESHASAKLRGILPPHLASAAAMTLLVAPGHRFEGPIPAFASSFQVLALYKNAFQSLSSSVHLQKSSRTVLLLHRNRLSCQLPPNHHSSSQATISLVAVGNHLTLPRHGAYPGWIAPVERDGLFWLHRHEGFRVVMKIVAGAGSLTLVLWTRLGLSKCRLVTARWHAAGRHHGHIAVMSMRLFASLASVFLGMCALLLLVLTGRFYVCPGALAQATVCLSNSFLPQAMMVAFWGRLWSVGRQPWWRRPSGAIVVNRDLSTRLAKGFSPRAFLVSWVSWISFVLVMSIFIVMDVAAKCTSMSLLVSSAWIRHVDASVGTFQGLLGGVALPYVATKFAAHKAGIEKSALISVASLLTTCLVPAFVVLYLDGECASRWTLWWTPCTERRVDHQIFNVEMKYVFVWLPVKVLRHDDICTPRFTASAASCARSVALKLQDVMFGKLIVSVFMLPAGRILVRRHYILAETAVVKMALLLELGILLGPPLPLLLPLLCVGVLSERLLAAVALDLKKIKTDLEPGSVRSALVLTSVSSVLFLGGFVSTNTGAMALFWSTLVSLLAPAWGLHQLKQGVRPPSRASWMQPI